MSGVVLIETKRFADARGWFSEVYSERTMAPLGVDVQFVQDNHSLSLGAGTLRGLHFQTPPFAQAKLVRCTRGAIFDVAVDIRRGSPTFGRWVGYELSAENGFQLFVPVGYAHGFITLEPSTEVVYKVSAAYAAENDSGIRWDDPAIGIDWRLPDGAAPILSDKDASQQTLSGFDSPFLYDGVPLFDHH